MAILKAGLKASNKNTLTTYHAARSNPKEGDIDWEVACAAIIRGLYKRKLSNTLINKIKINSPEAIEEAKLLVKTQALTDFEEQLDQPDFAEIIDEMYFRGSDLFKVAPEFQILRLAGVTSASSKNRLPNLFLSMIPGFAKFPVACPANFLEKKIISSFNNSNLVSSFDNITEVSKVNAEAPYLPEFTERFRNDLEFLISHPKYLLDHLQEFLKLYGYLYTTQLALNLTAYKAAPSTKPMYFMLEHESASKERVQLTNEGHRSAAKYFRLIFPYLSAAEGLQAPEEHERYQPLWKLYSVLKDEAPEPLKTYVEEFASAREEELSNNAPHHQTAQDWLEELLYVAERQFDKGKARSAANKRFVSCLHDDFCSEFAKSRGAGGKVAIINQDYLTLLTNISIGEHDKLRLSDLLHEFKQRGVFLDKLSQQALVKFYERMGNVERMSDSGDAVYVRKTI